MSGGIVRLSEHKENALVERVDTLMQYGAHQRAIRYCDEFIGGNPENPKACAIKHEIHVVMGEYEDSLQDAQNLQHKKGWEREGLGLLQQKP